MEFGSAQPASASLEAYSCRKARTLLKRPPLSSPAISRFHHRLLLSSSLQSKA